MAKLKVFTSQLGFYQTVVAAPSRKAALEAWGVKQDLFAAGAAGVTQDPGAIEAALARPGAVLRRAVGTKDAFGETSAAPDLPTLTAGRIGGAKPARRADRAALTRAERLVAKLEREHERKREILKGRAASLRAETNALERRCADQNAKARERLSKAAEAYRRAGGTEAAGG